ncbi:MAG: DUF1800 family protein [Xanthobacteraceae bacterium]|nr:DUF1800 family protein [Xanthobacteraceae bacterium]
MARDSQAALVALNRFGFGARGGAWGDFINAASDPRGYVAAELQRPETTALIESPTLQSTSALAAEMFIYQIEQKAERETDTTAAKGLMSSRELSAVMNKAASKPAPNIFDRTFRAESLARIQHATLAECGFLERLVAFWSNHFCISTRKGQPTRIWAGAFEREVIRPRVLGRFADILKAVEQHPAMLFFLDNHLSIGPNSRVGQRSKRGLNENLAREIMELHTLGVGGGYTQADVTALAKILTGWTYVGQQGRLGKPGTFAFNVETHEPGTIVLLGKSYADNGVEQGEAALADIARRPATAKFIATKMVRHFVADDPSPALVAHLADVFMETDGDLRAMSGALAAADGAWQLPMTKMRSPYEFLIAAGRLMAQIPETPWHHLDGFSVLGQPMWAPAGPNGFADTNSVWATPEGMKLRLDVAAQWAARIGDNRDPREMLDLVAAGAASLETRRTIARAESRQQALALLLMSPEFQRR